MHLLLSTCKRGIATCICCNSSQQKNHRISFGCSNMQNVPEGDVYSKPPPPHLLNHVVAACTLPYCTCKIANPSSFRNWLRFPRMVIYSSKSGIQRRSRLHCTSVDYGKNEVFACFAGCTFRWREWGKLDWNICSKLPYNSPYRIWRKTIQTFQKSLERYKFHVNLRISSPWNGKLKSLCFHYCWLVLSKKSI